MTIGNQIKEVLHKNVIAKLFQYHANCILIFCNLPKGEKNYNETSNERITVLLLCLVNINALFSIKFVNSKQTEHIPELTVCNLSFINIFVIPLILYAIKTQKISFGYMKSKDNIFSR